MSRKLSIRRMKVLGWSSRGSGPRLDTMLPFHRIDRDLFCNMPIGGSTRLHMQSRSTNLQKLVCQKILSCVNWDPDFTLSLKIQLKGCSFDTIMEIQCKSQKVLDTLQKEDFQDTWQGLCKRCVDKQRVYFLRCWCVNVVKYSTCL